MTKKYECLVCGRIFYEGQGIRISFGGRDVSFHSKTCALKFFRNLILYLDQKALEQAVKLTIKEFEERQREFKERTQKNIAKI